VGAKEKVSKLWEIISGIVVVIGGIFAAVLLRKSGNKDLKKATKAKTEAKVYQEQKERLEEDLQEEIRLLIELEKEAGAITDRKIDSDITSVINNSHNRKL